MEYMTEFYYRLVDYFRVFVKKFLEIFFARFIVKTSV